MKSLTSILDKVASSLESKGLIKEATEIDAVSNMIDKMAMLEDLDVNKILEMPEREKDETLRNYLRELEKVPANNYVSLDYNTITGSSVIDSDFEERLLEIFLEKTARYLKIKGVALDGREQYENLIEDRGSTAIRYKYKDPKGTEKYCLITISNLHGNYTFDVKDPYNKDIIVINWDKGKLVLVLDKIADKIKEYSYELQKKPQRPL